MVDIETDIFNYIAPKLREEFEGIYVSGEYQNIPPRFPSVSIEETNNSVKASTLDSSRREKFSDVVYDINVYSAKKNGRKTEARTIAKFIDELMIGLGFTRYFFNPIINEEDTIYRFTGRYTATVSENKTIYR